MRSETLISNKSLFSTMADELLRDLDNTKHFTNKIDENWDKEEIFDVQHDSPIQEFYKDQTVFITGATGFIGTLLVEKLLRCCPQIRKLILLVRDRGSKSVEERVRDYFQDKVFDRMRLANANYHEKVDIVCGQLDVDNFGLSSNDERLLTSQTTVIFHVAATVRFDEHIRTAYNINVRGTETLLSLAKRMPHLKSFVHVSTAYCNCDRQLIDEVFYPPTFTAEELSILVNSSSDEEMAILNEHLIAKKPNTYTFTKAAAEDLVRDVVTELPICVFRPSIVFPTLEEPMPSWIKGMNSVLALCLMSGIGLARVALTAPNIVLDLVPADRTINAMTALAWYQTTPHSKQTYQDGASKECINVDSRQNEDSKVFNYVSYNENPVSLYAFMRLVGDASDSCGESNSVMLWKRHTYYTRSTTVYFALFYILHTFPALALSLAEKLKGRKPMVMMYFRKFFFLTKIIGFFCLNEWTFVNANTRALVDAISLSDRKKFDASMTNFRWEPNFVLIPRTVGLYTLKIPLTKEDYRTRMIYIVWADYCIWLIIKVIAVYLVLDFLANQINSHWLY